MKYFGICFSPNTELLSGGVSFTSWGERSSLDLVDHPFSYGVIINIPEGVDGLLY